jgi:sugar phosphate isomerase/epimerase
MSITPGLMTYSYHLSFPEGKMTPERLMERITELHLTSAEWCHFPCHEPGKVDWKQVDLLDQLGRERGIANSIAGFAPLLARDDERRRMLDMVRTQLEVSKRIGAKRMRFHGMAEIALGIGVRPPIDVCLENLKRIVDVSEEYGIVLALENHMDFRTADFRHFFSHIESPFFRINLDTGNHLPLFEDVIAFAREFSEKIVSCHLKGVRFVWKDYGAVLTSSKPEESLVHLSTILDLLSRSSTNVQTHIEVVAMESAYEDALVGEYARFLQEHARL